MNSAMLQHPVPRHSLHNAASFISQPAPPFEGIVDFTSHSVRPMEGSHTHFGPYTASSDLAFQQLPAQSHRVDGTEWKQQSFFTYRPNEVKHRKRTTRQQLKVLEETFKTTQKPDGNVRKALAAQLDMTPRNVQVWFQNRRAKDKTLAKRAQKESQGNDSAATFDDSYSMQDSDQVYASPSIGQTYPQEQTFQAHYHSGSTSPIEATFSQKYEVPTPVHHSQDLTPPSQAISSTSTSFSSLESDPAPMMQSTFNYPVEQPNYSRDIYAPRASLPHIHATPYQPEIQHQRSNSSPAFLCNVDTISNLSLTTCASINGVLYPQRLASNTVSQQSQPMYNSSYPRVPSGPLPSADFSFGLSTQNNVHQSVEAEREAETTTFAPYQYGSVSGTATPSSLSGLSHYGSVASLVDNDDSAAPFGWQPEQRRGSAPQVYPLNRRSPLSVGYSNSPRVGATPPTEPESDSSIYVPHGSEWMPAYEESKQHNVSSDVKPVGGFSQDAPSDATFHYMGLLDAQSYNQPLSLANQISGLDVSFGTNNQLPLGGFRSMPTGGYFA